MTIIEKWRDMTTCKDCCKAKSFHPSGEWIHCERLDTNMPIKDRCSEGLWLFNGKSPGVIGGPYEMPFDLKDWLELMNPDTYTLIPREEWPEYKP